MKFDKDPVWPAGNRDSCIVPTLKSLQVHRIVLPQPCVVETGDWKKFNSPRQLKDEWPKKNDRYLWLRTTRHTGPRWVGVFFIKRPATTVDCIDSWYLCLV